MTKLFKRIAATAMAATMAASAVSFTTVSASAASSDPAFTVWANGKDVKANTKKNIEEKLNKTASVQHEGMFSGGKWNVMVTDTTIAKADDLVACFDAKGKLTETAKTMQRNMKNIATAKIKNGKITVTAGKEAGEFTVWVYEVKNKAVVNTKTVTPQSYYGITKMAPGSLNVSEKSDDMDKKIDAKYTVKEITEGESVTVYVCDKKAAIDADATITATATGATVEAVERNPHAFKITADAASNKTAKVTITCAESGKTLKLSYKIKAKATEEKKD